MILNIRNFALKTCFKCESKDFSHTTNKDQFRFCKENAFYIDNTYFKAINSYLTLWIIDNKFILRESI